MPCQDRTLLQVGEPAGTSQLGNAPGTSLGLCVVSSPPFNFITSRSALWIRVLSIASEVDIWATNGPKSFQSPQWHATQRYYSPIVKAEARR